MHIFDFSLFNTLAARNPFSDGDFMSLFRGVLRGDQNVLGEMAVLVFVFIMVAVVLINNGQEKEDRDQLAYLKAALYTLQLGAFQFLLMGTFILLNFMFSKMTSLKWPWAAGKVGLGMLAGAAVMFVFLEAVIIKVGTEKNHQVRKLVYGLALFLVGVVAVVGGGKFIGNLVTANLKGFNFHIPFTALLFYGAAFFFGVIYYVKWFNQEPAEGAVQTCLPMIAGMVQGIGAAKPAATIAAAPSAGVGMGGAPVGGAPAGGAFGAAAGAPVQAQAAQPSQAFGGAAQQPVAQQPVAQAGQSCPTCGAGARYIDQYQRYWCDSCKTYL